jgi:broad specificity phosphatase PhoE
MASVTLVRHAQASFFGADYDQLSELGLHQARQLGEYWADTGFEVDRVYVGPLRRHQQTLDQVSSIFRTRGLRFPDAQPLEALNEHDVLKVMKYTLAGSASGLATAPSDPGPAERDAIKRQFLEHYLAVMRDWSAGQLVVPDTESWSDFRHRSLTALDRLCDGRGRTVAFTSAGWVSSAIGWLLGLDDTRIIELSSVLRNTSLSELHHSARRRMMVSFNTVPHITDPTSITTM